MDFAVIMAGGSGQRLWPLSRQSRPKQILKLLNGRTLLRDSFERLNRLFDLRNILVLTNADYAEQVSENLSELPKDNIIPEPCVRDTAGAIGLAAAVLQKTDPEAVMAVVTSDHILQPAEPFLDALQTAIRFVKDHPEALLTFGIKPAFPATQYGYIRLEIQDEKNRIFPVAEFREKPDQKTAERFLAQGGYFWNSGMFVWKAKTILKHLKTFLPESSEPLEKIRSAWGGPDQYSALEEWFPRLPKISIDYAVLEKAPQIYGIPLSCRWLDMGSFAALADIISSDSNQNTVVAGQHCLLDCRNTIVAAESSDHLIAMIGMENVIVAHSPDATLICPIHQAHRIKELLRRLESEGKTNYL
ncbi:MAG TPA: sugar phosphate nucleotidyltransferase [Anaerohalosphaeraceae bacterium]|nr:sugar phosphate nucleotidyltransferase [Anaerohalosphaeraceae bacterium]HOL89550.1 sugar phosphate nucleotidyltransferase [Anaerohalosphaeraceae bacterium]HPP56284.1 sugar phosphate nucleotidyltransferase [Anaerohalosphaeraceae bacterium]